MEDVGCLYCKMLLQKIKKLKEENRKLRRDEFINLFMMDVKDIKENNHE